MVWIYAVAIAVPLAVTGLYLVRVARRYKATRAAEANDRSRSSQKPPTKKSQAAKVADADFHFNRDETAATGVRRMATGQIDAAVHVLTHTDELGIVESVHDFRKRCKKLRGLVRIVRPELGASYGVENRSLRDASRSLSASRDAQVMIETIDALVADDESGITAECAESIRSTLVADSDRAAHELEARPELISAALGAMADVRERIPSWTIDDDGFGALEGGITKVYGRGMHMCRRSADAPTIENLHDWRKRTKYLWHQIQMLEPCQPVVLNPLAKRLKALSDLLGDDHDLVVMIERIELNPERFGDEAAVNSVLESAVERRQRLQNAGLSLGKTIYVDTPEVFAAQLGSYWAAWHAPVVSDKMADAALCGTLKNLDAAAPLVGHPIRRYSRDVTTAESARESARGSDQPDGDDDAPTDATPTLRWGIIAAALAALALVIGAAVLLANGIGDTTRLETSINHQCPAPPEYGVFASGASLDPETEAATVDLLKGLQGVEAVTYTSAAQATVLYENTFGTLPGGELPASIEIMMTSGADPDPVVAIIVDSDNFDEVVILCLT